MTEPTSHDDHAHTPVPVPAPSFLERTAQIRQYFYGLLTPAVAVLMGYGILDANTAALWVGLGTAVLLGGTATAAITAQRRRGDLP